MTVLIATCFISITNGFVNANQISFVHTQYPLVRDAAPYTSVCTVGGQCDATGDSSPEQFMKRVKETCDIKVDKK